MGIECNKLRVSWQIQPFHYEISNLSKISSRNALKKIKKKKKAVRLEITKYYFN